MELHLEHNLQNREKRLQKLQELDQANMEQLLLELQQEHQQLVSMEAGSIDLTERRYYQELIEQNREQTLRIQKEIDKEYQKQISLVTPKAPVLKNVLRAFFGGRHHLFTWTACNQLYDAYL